MQQLHSWQFILQKLQHKIPVMLLYVVESKGSSPGRQGFFMAVDGNGKMHGSIGGGIMEHKFVEMAKDKLRSDETQSQLRKQVHSKSAQRNQSGMICSGEQTIVMYHLHENNCTVVQHITKSLLHHQNGTLTLTPEEVFHLKTRIQQNSKCLVSQMKIIGVIKHQQAFLTTCILLVEVIVHWHYHSLCK